MKLIASTLLLTGYSLVVAANVARAESPCQMPLVSTKSVALGMFDAIAGGLEFASKKHKYITEIQDEGGSWSVFQSLRNGNSFRKFTDSKGREMEAVRTTMGGGGLQMSINKCTGAISDVHWSR